MTEHQRTMKKKDARARSRWTNDAATALRAQLIADLGGKCTVCGTEKDIEFHHISGRDWDPHTRHRYTRLKIYQREISEGLITLLCHTCNVRAGDPREKKTEPPTT